MTWVIAGSSVLGAGALLSDTRVTFSNGKTAEILQKAYPVGNYVAAGFAGSVCIGLQLMDSLRDLMVVPDGTRPHAWEPRTVASDWMPIAKRIFHDAPYNERRLQSQVLLIGASPTDHMGAPEFPRIEIIRLVSPDFKPQFAKGGALTVRQIGSGSSVREYTRAIRPLFRLDSGIQKAHMAGIHEWARQLAFSVTMAVRDYQDHGISEHFHVVAVRLGDMAVYTNDMTTYPKDRPPIELKMPLVARSWKEFDHLASASRANASGAIC